MRDDPLALDEAQHDALAAFERDADVFDELGSARADDATRISAWVDRAVASSGAVGTAAVGASKAWIVGGALALVAGGVAAALLAGRGDPIEPRAPIEAPIVEASKRDAPQVEAPQVEAPQLEAPQLEAPKLEAPLVEPRAKKRAPSTAPALGAADLLREAANAKRDGDKTRALALYRRIGREFPRTREDDVAKVAIGRLELDLGHPDRALAAFDAYLRERSTGNLAEEAAFGRAAALRALGRTGDEREALRDFVARHPDSVQLERARTRLAQLGG